MGRACFLCNDPHRVEYEQVYLKTRSYKKTWQYAVRRYNTDIGYHVFRNHLKNHFKDIVDIGKESSKLRREVIKDDIHDEIQMSKALKRNLNFLIEIIDKLKNKAQVALDRNEIDMSQDEIDNCKDIVKTSLDVIYKINQTIELMLRFSDKLEIEAENDPDTLFAKLMDCMDGVPIEYIEIFAKKWKEKYA